MTRDLLSKPQMVLETEWCHLNISSITFVLLQASWSLLFPVTAAQGSEGCMVTLSAGNEGNETALFSY